MDERLRAYLDEIGPKWNAFLDHLADVEHPPDDAVQAWRPEDEAWYQARQHLDQIAAAYVAWQVCGTVINEWGPDMDDMRLMELVEPYIQHEPSRRVFLATCQRLVQEFKDHYK